jgi:hypothetical protein
MANRDFVVRKVYVSGIGLVGNPVIRKVVDRKPVAVGTGDAEADLLNAGILTGASAPPLRQTYDDMNHPDLDGLQVGDISYMACSATFS